MDALLSSTAFLSGCIPIALINIITNYDTEDQIVFWFAVIFMSASVLSAFYFLRRIKNYYRNENPIAIVTNIKRKDIFVSGAISYYVLPFISFITPGRSSVWILLLLIVLFLKVFHNNKMFLYTPLLDVFGYKILEVNLKIDNEVIKADLITKNGSILYFTGDNRMKVYKIDEGIYAAEACE